MSSSSTDTHIPFVKYHGAGNDFVIIDERKKRFAFSEKEIIHLCHRQFGIGADGLILLRNSSQADCRMLYFNADGKEASMCGNGARCLADFARKQGCIKKSGRIACSKQILSILPTQTLPYSSLADAQSCFRKKDQKKQESSNKESKESCSYPNRGQEKARQGRTRQSSKSQASKNQFSKSQSSKVCLDMGIQVPAPILQKISIGEKILSAYVLDTGVPHAIIIEKPSCEDSFLKLSQAVRLHPLFAPHGINCSFYLSRPQKLRKKTLVFANI